MIANSPTLNRKVKVARLPLIKERYQRLILRQRQEIEKELLESFRDDCDFDLEADLEPDQPAMVEAE